MPFKSKAQARAAFGGYLGPEMKAKAATWEDETPGGIGSLPDHLPAGGHTVAKKKAKHKPKHAALTAHIVSSKHK